MGLLTTRLDFDTAWDAEPMDARATITLLVVASLLSIQELAMGADFGFLVGDARGLPGTWWTLITSSLLHGNWLHLAFNLYWTYKFGVLLEAMFGTIFYSLILVGLALGSSAAELALGGPSIGLSGIGFGSFGLMWALGRWHPKCRGLLDRRVAEAFGAWFLLCIGLTWFDLYPIANVAHGAGFLIGALLGWAMSARGGRGVKRGMALVLLCVLITTLLYPPVRLAVNADARARDLFERGFSALVDEEWDAARELYEAFVELEPDMSAGWNNLALAYHELGRHGDSTRAAQRCELLEREYEEESARTSGFSFEESGPTGD